MSKDPKRIDSILSNIKKIWEKYPHLRLGQMLMNTGMNFNNFYYVEDESLVKHLAKIYKVDLSEKVDKDVTKIESTNESKKEVVEAEAPKSSNKGRVYIHRGLEVRSVAKEELDKYLSDGFSIGKKDK